MRVLSLEAYQKMHKKYTRQSKFGNWTTKIGSIENKIKEKNYRGHGKSYPRIENHANGMGNVPCQLHDFPFLFSMGPILLVQFPNLDCLVYFLCILDTLPMMVFSISDSILIKNYKIICQPSLLGALRVLLRGEQRKGTFPRDKLEGTGWRARWRLKLVPSISMAPYFLLNELDISITF
jgi:hypothetical protein